MSAAGGPGADTAGTRTAEIQHVVDLVAGRLDALAMLWVLAPDGRSLVPFVADAADPHERPDLLRLLEETSVDIADPAMTSIVIDRRAVLVRSVADETTYPAPPAYAGYMRDHLVHSYAMVPLISGVDVVGVLGAGRHDGHPALDDRAVDQLVELAAVAAPHVASLRTLTALRFHRLLLESVSDAVVAVDRDFVITAWNPAAARLYGWPAAAALGRPAHTVLAGDWMAVSDGRGGWLPQSLEAAGQTLVDTGSWQGRARQQRADGTSVLVEGSITALLDEKGRRTGYVAVNRDVTDLVAAEQEREASRLLAQTVLDASPAINVVLRRDGTVSAANTAWYRTLAELGHEEDERDLRAWLCLAANSAPVLSLVEQVLEGNRDGADLELEFGQSGDAPRWLAGQIVGLPNHSGAVLALVDTTSRRSLERRLAHRAQHDALTGLPTRSVLMRGLSRALARAQRTGRRVAVVFCDLDRFKDINDSLGHEQGDLALREAAHRIVSAARSHELVARFGGDEFVVVLEDVMSPEEVLPLTERILTAMREPIVLGVHEMYVGASLGIALSEHHGPDDQGEQLLSEADIAMYEAKLEGRGRAVVFQPQMRDRIRTRLALAAGLRHAVQNDELELLYQPVALLADDKPVAVEAFVRWRHPGRGLLGPDAFLSAAEESGAIVGVGEWVLDEAVSQLAAWEPLVPDDVVLSVNMSPRQLADPELVLTVAETLDRHGVAPGRLALEFTEAALLDDPEAAVGTLSRLAALGIRLVVDDFGSGLSSLARLEEVPFTTLKVDRHLTARADREPRAGALVRAVASLGHALGVTVVAEGIETAGQRAAAAAAGCDAYQGFLLSRPVAADTLPDLLTR